MNREQLTGLVRRASTLTAALALAGTPGGAAARQVNARYVPSVGAVYLIGLGRSLGL